MRLATLAAAWKRIKRALSKPFSVTRLAKVSAMKLRIHLILSAGRTLEPSLLIIDTSSSSSSSSK